jgi:thioredoxin reductase (NADPH)
MKKYRVIIVGSGPAAYTAAIYAARADLEPVVCEGFFSGVPGGQLMSTTDVENYPGFPNGVLGPDLMESFRTQAERFGTLFIGEDVSSIDVETRPFKVSLSSETIFGDAIIVATGAKAKCLDVPGAREHEFWQKGVTACAVCDGALPIFRNKDLYVIGGGDSAVEEALFLTKFAAKVFIVHRRDTLRASKIMVERALKHPKIEVLWNRTLVRVEGDKVVCSVVLQDVQTGKEESCSAGGVFFAIGHEPNTFFLKEKIALDLKGYIKVVPGSTQTSVAGIFAAGDVQDPIYRQAVVAAGSGCMAALDAERWLALQDSSHD